MTSATFTDTAGDDTFTPVSGTLASSDRDASETLTYGINGGAASNAVSGYNFAKAGTYGTLYLNTTSGAYKYVPNDGAIEGLKANASENFTFTVKDGSDATASQVFTVNLTGANDTPTLSPVTSATFTDTAGDDTFTPVSGTLVSSDRDASETLTYAVNGGAASNAVSGYNFAKAGTYGTLYLNTTNGDYKYVPNDAAIEAANDDKSEQFVFTVTDGSVTSTQTFTVNIDGTPEGSPLTVNDTTSAAGRYALSSDAKLPNVISLEAATLFSGGTGSVSYSYELLSSPASASWLTIVGGLISGNPNNSQAGNYFYKVTATDSVGSISTYVALTVLPDNGYNIEVVSNDASAGGLWYNSTNFHDVVTFTGGNSTEANAGGLIDVLLGQSDANNMNGGEGDDALYGMGGNDLLKGGAGRDFIDGGAGNDTIYGDDGVSNDTSNTGNDLLLGGAGNDTIRGGGGNDILDGGTGNDVLWGEAGDDNLTGGAGSDVFKIAGNHGTDVITDFTVNEDTLSVYNVTQVSSRANFAAMNTNDDNRLIILSSSATTSEILNASVGNLINANTWATNTYVLVYNSEKGRAEVWFDTNWFADGSRVLVAVLENIDSKSKFDAIDANDIAGFSDIAADPIILDLDKNGFAFSSLEQGVTFDINADGKGDQIAWTSDDGILAYDVDGNGLIDNGSEIFTPDFNGGKFASGVAALASLDSNGDGKIDSGDTVFGDLKIWVDANNNGVSDEGELSSLSDHGVTSISLTTDQTGGEEDGQTIFAEGEFTFADGSTGNFVEVGFDTIFGSDASDTLTVIGTDGDDILHGGMGQVVMTGGAGADTFVFDETALSDLDVADVITDFNSDEGDVLDVTALLDSLLGEQPDATVETHLRATVDDGNTTVSVQTGEDTWKDVVVLQNHDTAIKVLFDDKHTTVTPHE